MYLGLFDILSGKQLWSQKVSNDLIPLICKNQKKGFGEKYCCSFLGLSNMEQICLFVLKTYGLCH